MAWGKKRNFTLMHTRNELEQGLLTSPIFILFFSIWQALSMLTIRRSASGSTMPAELA
jgi:hypothetical protein